MRKSSKPRGDAKQPARSESARQRRPYSKPRLVDHGNLRELTLAKDGVKSDGGVANPPSRV